MKRMNDTDKAYVVTAAIDLGFIVSDHDELKCTHDQLCELCIEVANAAVNQYIDKENEK